ncbi:TM2 domain-containing protein [Phytohabitans kaempferiae]|uniref:TM2 domain-containing protein n=1 Tax=Phytohabitans kaempferiae TaxID=1620943 RepID=A0ABV6M2F4_9ACTN
MTAPAAPKSLALAYLLCVFTGVFGGHYFYLGVNRRAVLYLLTFGCLTFGVLIDLFTLPSEVRRTNREIMAGRLTD